VTDKEPKFVGVDPFNKWIDRNSDDNLGEVSRTDSPVAPSSI
jgi:ABC-2 type transport system permease protein